MNPSRKSLLIKYGACVLVCLLVAAVYVMAYDIGSQSLVDQYRLLCDAFTIPGIMCILIGLLLLVSNAGVFHGIGYVVSVAVKALTPGGRQHMETYFDYLSRKRGGKVTGFDFLFVVGGVLMVLAFFFRYLFYQHFIP